jgi:hypothetical protein
MSPAMQPILLNACARAATASEAAFRIDRPIGGRTARVVALDDGAAATIRRVAERPWSGARFYVAETGTVADGNGGAARDDVSLRAAGGAPARLSAELEDADVAIVVATSDEGAAAAGAIADACERRGIMTAGLILGERSEVREAVNALRPHAPVMLVSDDEEDVAEVLTALRA